MKQLRVDPMLSLLMIWSGLVAAVALSLAPIYWIAWLWAWCLVAEASDGFRASRKLVRWIGRRLPGFATER